MEWDWEQRTHVLTDVLESAVQKWRSQMKTHFPRIRFIIEMRLRTDQISIGIYRRSAVIEIKAHDDGRYSFFSSGSMENVEIVRHMLRHVPDLLDLVARIQKERV